MPTIDAWLQAAAADAERQGHEGVKPVLDGLASTAAALRMATWSADATDTRRTHTPPSSPDPAPSPRV